MIYCCQYCKAGAVKRFTSTLIVTALSTITKQRHKTYYTALENINCKRHTGFVEYQNWQERQAETVDGADGVEN